ncbi:unnamed protein product [Adineta steineri]|uniref:Uncharacterized protein n=1 Tax=Adineta steineri TaxID=433720 RepID=A0A815APK6_9BILA|nr:unnamed protein product [Adineta steineri]CAF1497112.1 unnamed protein product [Adineta steineri]
MGPQRNNMALLEIVDLPTEPLPPNIELSMILSRVEPYTSTCSAGISNNLTNQSYDPMTDIPLSIETGELESSNQQSVVDIANAAMVSRKKENYLLYGIICVFHYSQIKRSKLLKSPLT